MKQLSIEEISFWEKQAEQLPWFKRWDSVLSGQEPFFTWFAGGTINASHVCLDAHINAGRGEHTAIFWEDEQGNKQRVSYKQLYHETNKIAAALRRLGVQKGDRVVIYLPMIPEAVATMLAVARLGAIHVVVFSGFGAEALRERLVDVEAKVVVTADLDVRRGKNIYLKDMVDKALSLGSDVEHVVVFKRFHSPCAWQPGRDVTVDDVLVDIETYHVIPEEVDSSHPLFVLHTSGSTGKPKGIMHATGGYLTYVYETLKTAFNIDSSSVYWCTADIGWITGHSYVVYGPLMHGAAIVMYDGAPDTPSQDVWWRLIERYKVTIFYTAPTALRAFMRLDDAMIRSCDLSSLQVLGSVGEPLNPQVWQWYYEMIGGGSCPVIDTWWQTETGGFMIAPQALQPVAHPKPGSVTKPMPGIHAEVVDEQGKQVPAGTKGFLVITKPWPGMLVGFFDGNQERYLKTYWTRFPGCYFSGDYAIKDANGDFWMLGRADEVLNIAGHRVGTAEVESAMLTHAAVVEAAAIGVHDDIKGESVVVFVVLKDGFHACGELTKDLMVCVHTHIGKFVTPSAIHVLERLPKTRSGKIMRRVLKAMLQGTPLGDVTTMEDAAVVDEVKAVYRDFVEGR